MRLERSRTERMISGVCGGIAEYLQIDATLVRVFFVALAVFGGIGLIVYIVLLILMPLPGTRLGDAAPATGVATEATVPVERAPLSAADAARRRELAGYAIAALGVLFLLNNVGALRFLDWRYVWPLALIGIGVLLVVQRTRR